jgi:hypothetical protein
VDDFDVTLPAPVLAIPNDEAKLVKPWQVNQNVVGIIKRIGMHGAPVLNMLFDGIAAVGTRRHALALMCAHVSSSFNESLPIMLGPTKSRHPDRAVIASLESLVPSNHFYRHLHATLDLSFVWDWVAELYAPVGRPSIDPVVFFRLQLILFFEGYRSERQLMSQVALNLAHRQYVGYNLDEVLPDHSGLTRIRQRLGLDLFR